MTQNTDGKKMAFEVHCVLIEDKHNPECVVMRGLEFPNVIVQGKDVDEARINFQQALSFYFEAKANIEQENYPLKNDLAITACPAEFLNG